MGRASDAGRLTHAQPTRPLTAPPNLLPPQVVLWVELTPAQRTEYRRLLEKSYHALTATKSASGAASKGNLGWQLRLLCDHPNLNLRDPRPASLPAPGGPAAEAALASLVDASGKLRLLHKLLGKLRANKQRVLIFSQFKNMLDLIEDSLHLGGYPHERLDGSVRRDLRDAAIDRFQRGSDADAFAFLLTTRAGGVGITLTAADTVVLYDSDCTSRDSNSEQRRTAHASSSSSSSPPRSSLPLQGTRRMTCRGWRASTASARRRRSPCTASSPTRATSAACTSDR